MFQETLKCLGTGSLVGFGSVPGLPSLLYVKGDSSPVTTVPFTHRALPASPSCILKGTHHHIWHLLQLSNIAILFLLRQSLFFPTTLLICVGTEIF